ncbi:unnamed protein product [Rodentolepis nana]|uniref:TLC domain-containing protein n=1 Tax=Rodentolepis nana TaxID=102285 RepID=A0A0R3T058_RODNA|nr:unnamed protein product [Rodentolepis nana]
MIKYSNKKNKNPSYFSHEFIIANHGDIVSVVAMVFIGSIYILYFRLPPYSCQCNTIISDIQYTVGRYDVLAFFFYTLICIIIHAVIQEYILDKLSKRLHLPRFMQSKFNHSGQLLFFYVFSVYWAVYAIINERYLASLSDLWSGYPHSILPFWIKAFFIFQISYWIHNFPELYFQKVKKSEIPSRIFYSSLFLIGLIAGYFMNFSKLTMIMVVLHYTTDIFFHFALLMKFYGYTAIVQASFTVYNGLYVISRSLCFLLLFTLISLVMAYPSDYFLCSVYNLFCLHVSSNDVQKRKEKGQKKGKQEDAKEFPNDGNNGIKHKKQKAQ